MPNEEYLDYAGLNRFLDKLREKELKNRARNYVINPSETLTSEYLNSSFNNADDMSIALRKASNGTDFKLKDVDGNDILIKDLKLGDLVSIRQISEYYPERFVGLIDTNFVHFYAYTCLAFNHIVQGSMKPVTSGAVYNALLPFNKVSTTTSETTNIVEVPSSAKGLATLKQIGGMSYKCKNLCQIGSWNNGMSNTTTATIGLGKLANGTYTLSLNAIDINSRTIILYYFNNGVRDTTNQITTNINSNGQKSYTFTIDGSVVFDDFRIGVNSAVETTVNLTNIMLNTGSTALPYEAYYEGIHDSAVTKVESVGANLCPNNWTNQKAFDGTTGDIVNNSTHTIDADYIPVKPNTQYTLKGASTYNYLFEYDSNKNYIQYVRGTGSTLTITTTANTRYLRVQYESVTNIPVMLNKGSTALPYAPYKTYELAIASAICSITGYGWGVNENCYNYLDLSLNEFRQYVARVDLSTLTFTTRGDGTFYSASSSSLPLAKESYNVLSAKYSHGNPYVNPADNLVYVFVEGGQTTILIRDTSSGGNITGYLYYELATPVITDVSSLLDEVHIPIEANGTLELVNPYNNAVPVIVSFDNGLVDVVLTNHEHDIEQQKDIDELKANKQDKLTPVGGIIINSATNEIKVTDDVAFERYRTIIALIDTGNNMPICQFDYYDGYGSGAVGEALMKQEAIMLIQDKFVQTSGNLVFTNIDANLKDCFYYEDGYGFVRAYSDIIGLTYNPDDTGQEFQIFKYENGSVTSDSVDESNIGDDAQSTYYFKVVASYRVG